VRLCQGKGDREQTTGRRSRPHDGRRSRVRLNDDLLSRANLFHHGGEIAGCVGFRDGDESHAAMIRRGATTDWG
jgi:hypothetical protein